MGGRRRRCCVSAALALTLCATPLLALDPSKRVTQYMRDGLGREDGLPQSSVQSIVQTRDGYLWFATQQGLARYNGARIVSFANWNTPEIQGDDVQVLYEDRSGTLWMGSYGNGIAQWRDGRFRRLPARLSSGFVFAITQDARGGMWIGTDGGLNHLVNGRIEAFTTKRGLGDDKVYAVLARRDGSVWAGTRRGLSEIRNGVLRTYTTRDGLPSNAIRSLYEDRSGTLWIGTLGGGVARLQNGKLTPIGASEGLPNLDVFSILEDRDGNVWIATGGGGLARFRKGRISVLTSGAGLASDTVLSLLEDAEGSLWIGTEGGGVTRLKDSKFASVTKADGLSHDIVMSVYEDAKGDIWLGTLGGGVNRLSGETIRSYTARDGLSSDMVFAVSGDRSGSVWIGTADGLNRLYAGRFTTYRAKDGLPSSAVTAIYEDRAGTLWFGTPDGVSRFRDGRFTSLTTSDGLADNRVLAVLEDRRGTLWFGTAAGLSRFDGRTFTTFGPKDGLADDLVMGLHEDDDGVLWVATRKGLSRLAGGRFTTLTRKDGLFDDLVLATLDDHHGSLWVSSNNGVFRLSKRELADFAAHRIARVQSTPFGTADGLGSAECNGGVQPSAWRSGSGILWFPTVKGVAYIDPAHIRTNAVPPPAKIEQVIADERIVPMLGPLRLAAGTHRLEIQFAGLSFAAPERVHFRYRLEGFDGDWIDGGTRRSAIYTNLSPGSYRFAVVAANNDGLWSAAPATLDIEQAPFFHQTPAFVALCVLAVAALGALFFFSWTRRIRAVYAGKLAERARISLELHDTVAQGLVSVHLLLDLAAGTLASDAAATRRYIERAAAVSQETLGEVRRVLANLRPSALDEKPLPAALESFVNQAAEGFSPRPHVVVQGTPRPLPPEVENDLLRIAQEAITNALRHANASRVEVELLYETERVRLRVVDDGVGSGEHDLQALASERYGVRGMRERAARMKAQLRITSKVSEGTEVFVHVDA
ncbi:MAG TPA: two-component regulator propeller domain-containing protein [Thermoanaerobaculia bacterium]|nr:two-component regulator propeller domain-containing protein [Thermoanaerobaculia bacterium]